MAQKNFWVWIGADGYCISPSKPSKIQYEWDFAGDSFYYNHPEQYEICVAQGRLLFKGAKATPQQFKVSATRLVGR